MNHGTTRLIAQVGLVAFAALVLGNCAQGFTFTAFTAGLPQMAESFAATGHGMEIAQQSVTIAALGVIAGAFLSGMIVEKIGTRATALIMIAAFGITGCGGLVFANPWPLFASRILNGFTVACLMTACVNSISTLFDGNARARMIGIASSVGAAMSLIGMLIGGVLAQRLGWRAAFLQFPVFGIVAFAIAFAGTRDNPKRAIETGDTVHSWIKLLPLLLLAMVINVITFMGATQLAFLLPQDGVSAATTISLVMGTITFFAVLVGVNYGALEHRFGLQRTLALGFTFNAAGLALLGLVPSLAAAFLGAALIGAYVGISVPYPYHAVTLKTRPQARAKAIGAIVAFNYIGAVINPFIFAPMTSAFGLHNVFLIAGVFMGILAVGALLKPRTPVNTLVPPLVH